MKLCPIRTSRLFRKLLPPLKMLLSALKYWIYCLILVYFQLEKRTRPEGSFVLLIVKDVMVTLMVHGKPPVMTFGWAMRMQFSTSLIEATPVSHNPFLLLPTLIILLSFAHVTKQLVPLERSFIIVKSEKLMRLSSSVRWWEFWMLLSWSPLISW